MSDLPEDNVRQAVWKSQREARQEAVEVLLRQELKERRPFPEDTPTERETISDNLIIPLTNKFEEVVANFDDEECKYCATDLGCGCYTVEELKAMGAYESGESLGGIKSEKCKCDCGQCYAPWGEVLDD